MKYLLIAIIALTLNGCMSSTYKGMITKPNIDKKTYTIDENYQELYHRAVDVTEECYEAGMITAAITSDKKINTDRQEASIAIYMIGGLGKQYQHIAEFKAIDKDVTSLTIFSEISEKSIDIMKRSFTGECKKCYCDDK